MTTEPRTPTKKSLFVLEADLILELVINLGYNFLFQLRGLCLIDRQSVLSVLPREQLPDNTPRYLLSSIHGISPESPAFLPEIFVPFSGLEEDELRSPSEGTG